MSHGREKYCPKCDRDVSRHYWDCNQNCCTDCAEPVTVKTDFTGGAGRPAQLSVNMKNLMGQRK